MSKKVTVASVVAALLVALPALALGATAKKNHSFTATTRQAMIASSGGTPPAAGSTETDAGSFTSNLATGAELTKVTYAAGNKFSGGATIFGVKGTVKVSTKGSFTIAGGAISATGSGKVLSGTGLYKGATGSFTFTGTRSLSSTVLTAKFKGKLKY